MCVCLCACVCEVLGGRWGTVGNYILYFILLYKKPQKKKRKTQLSNFIWIGFPSELLNPL